MPISLKLKIVLKLYKKDKLVKYYQPLSWSRFRGIIGRVPFDRAYVKVSYGKRETSFGSREEFINEADVYSVSEAIKMVKYFLDKDR